MLVKSLAIAMKEMRQVDVNGYPVPFDIELVTADKRRKKAGEFVSHTGCTLPTARRLTTSQRHTERLAELGSPHKDPHHKLHGTINIRKMSANKNIKVHVRLITEFNGYRIIW